MNARLTAIRKTLDAGPLPAADRRGRLLSAALLVLHEEGIHALTQTRVAAVAGLRQSHLTYYFPTRIDLLKATVEHAAGAVMALVGDGAQSMATSLNDVRSILCHQISDTRMPRLMIAMAVAADEDPSLKAWMAAFDLRVRNFFAMALQRFDVRVSASDLALFHATLVGVALLNYSAGTPSSARQARALVKAAFDRVVADAF